MMARRLGIGCVVLGLLTSAGGYAGAEGARPLTQADAAAGKAAYIRECSACHGERGNGAGRAAEFVNPKPRDFTAGKFKLRTTASGRPPATADVLRVIERGIPGTAMPSFSFLPSGERRQIAAYVLKLADLLDEPEPEELTGADDAPPASPETVARGKQVYADLGCASCHGALGRGDGPSAAALTDEAGAPIRSRDLTQDHMRGGSERVDLYYRLIGGLDGTPMPGYADAVPMADLWALIDYLRALRAPGVVTPPPADRIAAGRVVADKYSCRGCHVLDDGKGGDAGPDLRVAGQKLQSPWVRTFLKAPREYGKIYPWRAARMPHLGLSDTEVETMTRYLAAMGKRPEEPSALPDPAAFPEAKVNEGKLLYMLRCTECHNLGTVIETIPIKQQGPDLIRVAPRIDYEWAKGWITNPAAIDPKTKMTVPNLTPDQVEAVRMFVWKAAIEAGAPTRAALAPR